MPYETKHQCPACNIPLQVRPALDDGFEVWCMNGFCTNKTAENGAFGETINKAVMRLTENVEKELNEHSSD